VNNLGNIEWKAAAFLAWKAGASSALLDEATKLGWLPKSQADLWEIKDVVGATSMPDEAFGGRDNGPLARDLRRQQRRQAVELVADMARIGVTLTIEKALSLLDDERAERWMNEVAQLSRSHISVALDAAGTDSIRSVGVNASFNLENQNAINYLDNASRRIGRKTTDTYRGVLREQIIEGFKLGESTKEITKRIEDVTSGDIVGHRAERIARTETAFAHIKGTEEGWKQSGVVKGSQFVLAPDACPLCIAVAEELGEKTFPLGQAYFDVGTVIEGVEFAENQKRDIVLDYEPEEGAGLVVPPVHPHCRCSRRPILHDEFL
jgi:hypothetical protein